MTPKKKGLLEKKKNNGRKVCKNKIRFSQEDQEFPFTKENIFFVLKLEILNSTNSIAGIYQFIESRFTPSLETPGFLRKGNT